MVYYTISKKSKILSINYLKVYVPSIAKSQSENSNGPLINFKENNYLKHSMY